MTGRVWRGVGRVGYIVLWPLLFAYLPFTNRTRVLVLVNDDVLVVKGWLGSGQWYLPGGGLHRGENPVTGALRELREETGIICEVNNLQQLGSGRMSERGLRFGYHQFVVLLAKKPELHLPKTEIVEAAWVSPVTLNHENATKAVLDTIAAWKRSSVSDTIE